MQRLVGFESSIRIKIGLREFHHHFRTARIYVHAWGIRILVRHDGKNRRYFPKGIIFLLSSELAVVAYGQRVTFPNTKRELGIVRMEVSVLVLFERLRRQDK